MPGTFARCLTVAGWFGGNSNFHMWCFLIAFCEKLIFSQVIDPLIYVSLWRQWTSGSVEHVMHEANKESKLRCAANCALINNKDGYRSHRHRHRCHRRHTHTHTDWFSVLPMLYGCHRPLLCRSTNTEIAYISRYMYIICSTLWDTVNNNHNDKLTISMWKKVEMDFC